MRDEEVYRDARYIKNSDNWPILFSYSFYQSLPSLPPFVLRLVRHALIVFYVPFSPHF